MSERDAVCAQIAATGERQAARIGWRAFEIQELLELQEFKRTTKILCCSSNLPVPTMLPFSLKGVRDRAISPANARALDIFPKVFLRTRADV